MVCDLVMVIHSRVLDKPVVTVFAATTGITSTLHISQLIDQMADVHNTFAYSVRLS